MRKGARLTRGRGAVFLFLAAITFLLANECLGAGPALVVDRSARRINVDVGKSVIVKSPEPVTRVSVASEGIADYLLLSPNQIYITGKHPGVTNMTLWKGEDKISAVYDIEVAPETSRLKAQLQQILPEESGIRVNASNEALTLSGTVSNASSQARAVSIAEAYATGKDQKIINLLQVSGVQQVMLEVRVAEMTRSLVRHLGSNFVVNNNGSIGGSLVGNLVSVKDFVGSGTQGSVTLNFSNALNSFFHIAAGDTTWTQFLDALKEEGLIRILAEPTLITQSGQEAKFLAGGEFPIPVPQGLGTVAIEYKQFGVQLAFTPTILADGKISMRVNPEVSQLDYTTLVTIQGIAVPGLTTRRVSTMVELGDGQSFAVAGLLQDTIRDTISKFPLLGELPVLGPLFRSTSYQRNETELVIIVTPHLVKPLNMARTKLPTDDYIDPNDCEFYLMGLIKGRAVAPPASPLAPARKSGFDGEFGHAVPGL